MRSRAFLAPSAGRVIPPPCERSVGRLGYGYYMMNADGSPVDPDVTFIDTAPTPAAPAAYRAPQVGHPPPSNPSLPLPRPTSHRTDDAPPPTGAGAGRGIIRRAGRAVPRERWCRVAVAARARAPRAWLRCSGASCAWIRCSGASCAWIRCAGASGAVGPLPGGRRRGLRSERHVLPARRTAHRAPRGRRRGRGRAELAAHAPAGRRSARRPSVSARYAYACPLWAAPIRCVNSRVRHVTGVQIPVRGGIPWQPGRRRGARARGGVVAASARAHT